MHILVPTEITPAMVLSSSIAEPAPGESVWAVGTTYALGALVISTTTHLVYKSAIANNVGFDPTVAANFPGKWSVVGPTLKYAAFDEKVSTRSTGTSPLTYRLKPGPIDSFSAFGLNGNDVRLIVYDGSGNVVFDRFESLETGDISDYWEYFFDPFVNRTEVTMLDIPPYQDCQVLFTMTGGGTIGVGKLVVGSFFYVGETQWDAKVKLNDWSLNRFESDGTNTILKRGSSRDLNLQVRVDIDLAVSVFDTIDSLLSVPVICVGSEYDQYSALRVYGTVTAELTYPQWGVAMLSVTVKGRI